MFRMTVTNAEYIVGSSRLFHELLSNKFFIKTKYEIKKSSNIVDFFLLK